MKLGIAIPCYNKHIPKLLELLDSIEGQTRKPDAVCVSCSSTGPTEFPILRDYGFPISIIATEERLNTAKNRNIAARHLQTDIVSFFDADDIMHPQRLELIERAFTTEPCDMTVHGYLIDEETTQEFETIQNADSHRNVLMKGLSGCLKLPYPGRIHHSQVSVAKHVCEKLQFPEEPCFERKEDSVFCNRVLDLPDIHTAYIPHALSKYIEAKSWIS